MAGGVTGLAVTCNHGAVDFPGFQRKIRSYPGTADTGWKTGNIQSECCNGAPFKKSPSVVHVRCLNLNLKNIEVAIFITPAKDHRY